MKIWAKKYSSFSSYFNPKIVGDNRSSEQIFTETVCWVPLFLDFKKVSANSLRLDYTESQLQQGHQTASFGKYLFGGE